MKKFNKLLLAIICYLLFFNSISINETYEINTFGHYTEKEKNN